MRAFCAMQASESPIVATAVHAGHDVRSDVAPYLAIDAPTRQREEDPFTDRLANVGGAQVIVHRSRFEVDVNRPREAAVYSGPETAWGLAVWSRPLPRAVRDRSLALYDEFYADLARELDIVAARAPFLVLDVHSYNHRRAGPDTPAAPVAENPEINVGTGAVDRIRWGGLVDRFIEELRGSDTGGPSVDVRENVRFRGGHLSRWVCGRYGDRACALALEFKKTFMDEWTGVPDLDHLDRLRGALEDAADAALAELTVRSS